MTWALKRVIKIPMAVAGVSFVRMVVDSQQDLAAMISDSLGEGIGCGYVNSLPQVRNPGTWKTIG